MQRQNIISFQCFIWIFSLIYLLNNLSAQASESVYSSKNERVKSFVSGLNEERESKEMAPLTLHPGISASLKKIINTRKPVNGGSILQTLINNGFQFFAIHIISETGSPNPWQFLGQIKKQKNWDAFLSPNYTHTAIYLQTLKKNKGRWTVLLFTPED